MPVLTQRSWGSSKVFSNRVTHLAGGEALSSMGFHSQQTKAEIDREFEDFFRQEYGRIYQAAYLFCGDPEIAMDAFQEAFSRAYGRWRRVGRQVWRSGWVMVTCLNLCKRLSRQRARRFAGFTTEDTARGVDPADPLHLVYALKLLAQRQS